VIFLLQLVSPFMKNYTMISITDSRSYRLRFEEASATPIVIFCRRYPNSSFCHLLILFTQMEHLKQMVHLKQMEPHCLQHQMEHLKQMELG